MLKSLVTGACGFIGSNLALELERLGHEVLAVDSLKSGRKENLSGFKGKIVHADLSKPFDIQEKVDFIFHQAAITDPRYEDDKELLHQNLTGFDNILDIARKQKAKVIYASTAGLYGNGPIPMKESQAPQIQTVYGESKLRMDQKAESLFKELSLVGLRYFNVYGPRESSKGRPASMVYHLWTQMKAGRAPKLFKWGEQKRDFIYVKDIVRANLLAMHSPNGVFNVGTGAGATFNDLVTALNAAMGLDFKPEYFDMPYDPATYQSNTQADTEKAKKVLGFTAEWNLTNGVKDYVQCLENSSPL